MKKIVELSKEKMMNIHGGIWPLIGVYVAIAWWCANEHDNLADGWNAAAKDFK